MLEIAKQLIELIEANPHRCASVLDYNTFFLASDQETKIQEVRNTLRSHGFVVRVYGVEPMRSAFVAGLPCDSCYGAGGPCRACCGEGFHTSVTPRNILWKEPNVGFTDTEVSTINLMVGDAKGLYKAKAELRGTIPAVWRYGFGYLRSDDGKSTLQIHDERVSKIEALIADLTGRIRSHVLNPLVEQADRWQRCYHIEMGLKGMSVYTSSDTPLTSVILKSALDVPLRYPQRSVMDGDNFPSRDTELDERTYKFLGATPSYLRCHSVESL